MKKILPIICLAWLLLSCNSEQKYRQLAEEFLKDIPSERVIATFTDVDRHCIFYIEEDDLGFMTEAGDKYDNIVKYDLKTQKYSKLLRDEAKKLNPILEQGAGFITIDHFEVNSSSIFIASYINVGYYDLALYSIDTEQWHYLGNFPLLDELSITENGVYVVCRINGDRSLYDYANFFGPLTWSKSFDMNGDCIENSVYDELAQKSYDAHRLIENKDVDYIEEIYNKNPLAELN